MSNIVIVGANRGIGFHMTQSLLEQGNRVAVLDIRTEQIEQLRDRYPNALTVLFADAAEDASVADAVEKAYRALGSVDIAVYNACLCTFESEEDTDIAVYRRVMNVNYFGALRLAKAVLPHMRAQRSGRLIFTSSGVGVTGFLNISPYASSKGAMESLAKCLEIENAKYGISVHIFHPPLTDTESAAGLPIPKEFKTDAQKVGYGLAKHIRSKRFVICPTIPQSISMALCYRYPLLFGKLMAKATARQAEKA
ncbi:MAG: SDR family NAD(P)-dependent oxidoreductase [Christensenellales bacterium]|jgi:NAD(P)-dependent dehydrogenase (short-subunit alcohol dehydrogenase family)